MLAIVHGSHRLTVVFDQLDVVLVTQLFDPCVVTTVAQKVDCHDGTGVAVDSVLEFVNVYVPCVGVNVHEFQSEPILHNRKVCGCPSNDRHNYVAGQFVFPFQ